MARAAAMSSATMTIVDPGAEEAYEKVLDNLEIHRVLDLTQELDERERIVIRSRYGLVRTRGR